MKIRIQGDSIRLRLSSDDTTKFSDGQFIQETTHFPGEKALQWVLEPSALATEVTAKFETGRVIVSVPLQLARVWWNPDVNSLENRLTIPEDPSKSLFILIEKDFDL
jgi:hypothetical protein